MNNKMDPGAHRQSMLEAIRATFLSRVALTPLSEWFASLKNLSYLDNKMRSEVYAQTQVRVPPQSPERVVALLLRHYALFQNRAFLRASDASASLKLLNDAVLREWVMDISTAIQLQKAQNAYFTDPVWPYIVCQPIDTRGKRAWRMEADDVRDQVRELVAPTGPNKGRPWGVE